MCRKQRKDLGHCRGEGKKTGKGDIKGRKQAENSVWALGSRHWKDLLAWPATSQNGRGWKGPLWVI